MRIAYRLQLLLISLFALALAGCDDGGGGSKGSAYVRLLNVSPGYDSLDVYVDSEDDKDDSSTRRLEAVGYESVSEYIELDSGSYSFQFKRNGVSGALRTIGGQKLTDDSHVTYIGYGSTGNFNVLSLGEDVEEPEDGETYVQLINAAEGIGTLDVYFTDADVDLENVSPNISDVGYGATTVDSGTYRLRITGADDTDDIRLDIAELELTSGGVLSIILTATSGGTLVNAILLPQRGAATPLHNTKARVRGAIGISSGLATTMRVGGVTLLSNATSGAIGSGYVQIDAGQSAIDLIVDGTPFTLPSRTIAAGGDYTLLAWNEGDEVQATLIDDDNSLPRTSGKAKLRVINGLSGFGGPINLAVDYSPIAEGIALGEASSFALVDGGTGYQLDVASTNTSQNLVSRDSVTLQTGSIYTLFVAGGQSSEQTSAILRKDR